MASTDRPILIVDDEPELRDVLREYLEGRGHEVMTAGNGLEALWAVKHRSPALVFLDLAMPRLDGLDTIKHIQKFDPSIRIVVVTAHADPETTARLQALGIPTIFKPVDFVALQRLVG